DDVVTSFEMGDHWTEQAPEILNRHCCGLGQRSPEGQRSTDFGCEVVAWLRDRTYQNDMLICRSEFADELVESRLERHIIVVVKYAVVQAEQVVRTLIPSQAEHHRLHMR